MNGWWLGCQPSSCKRLHKQSPMQVRRSVFEEGALQGSANEHWCQCLHGRWADEGVLGLGAWKLCLAKVQLGQQFF